LPASPLRQAGFPERILLIGEKAERPYERPETGKLRAVHILLGHTKIESTARYLYLEVVGALAPAERRESNRGNLSRSAAGKLAAACGPTAPILDIPCGR